MTVETVELDAAEVEQMRADLAAVRAEVRRLRAERLAQHPDRTIDDKFERVVAERDDLAGALVETERERDKAEAERDHLAEQNAALREVNVRLGRAESENDQLSRAVNVMAGERDTAAAKAQEMGNELAEVRAALRDVLDELKDRTAEARGARDDYEQMKFFNAETADERDRLRQQLADCEAALVEANSARRLSNAEHLHQRIAAARLVIGRFDDWRYCPLCRDLREASGARHACGPQIPVDVIVARRPNPPTTEEADRG